MAYLLFLYQRLFTYASTKPNAGPSSCNSLYMATSSSSGAIQYLSAVRQPSLLSFESETGSILGTASSDVTATTSSTIWGPGAIAGKGILGVGKAILRGTTAVVIQVRLQVLKSLFPHNGGSNDEGTLHKAYRDMLELTRCVRYPGFHNY
jgi:hypothetical protein